MNLPITVCLLGVLIIALETPFKYLTNKTVQSIRLRRKKNALSKLLNEVTQKIRNSGKLEVCKYNGVAKEIASPNVPRIGPGWRYYGDEISFIITNDDPYTVSVIYGEKRILIWAKTTEKKLTWFFYDESRVNVKLSGHTAKQAEEFCGFAQLINRLEHKRRLQKKSSELKCLDPEVV